MNRKFLYIGLAFFVAFLYSAGGALANKSAFTGNTLFVYFDSNICYQNGNCGKVSYVMKYYFAKDGRLFAYYAENNQGVQFKSGERKSSYTTKNNYNGSMIDVGNFDSYTLSGNSFSIKTVQKIYHFNAVNTIEISVRMDGKNCTVANLKKRLVQSGVHFKRQWLAKQRCKLTGGRS